MSDETKRKRPRGTGSIFSVPGSRNLWVGYTGANGEYIRESCGSPKKEDAKNFLKRRMEAVSGGNFLGPRVEKITVDELYRISCNTIGRMGTVFLGLKDVGKA